MVSRLWMWVAACLMAFSVLIGCTDGGDKSGAGNSRKSTEAQPDYEPLALIVHHTRGSHNLKPAAVRQLLAQGVDTWSDLGMRGGSVNVVAAGINDADNGDDAILTADSIKRLQNTDKVLQRVRNNPDTLGLIPASAVDETVRTLTVAKRHPLRKPGKYRPKIPAEQPVGDVVTISVVGDIMLGRRVGDELARVGDPAAVLRPMADRLDSADVTIGNLESTLSKAGEPRQGTDSFGARPNVRKGLKLAGFDVLVLANNHLGDYGPKAMRDTFTRVRKGGFKHVGAGKNLKAARSPAIVKRHNTRIGIIATESIGETPAAKKTSAGTNRLNMPPRTGPMDKKALNRIAADIADLAADVDTVMVIPHWGTQYTNVPEKSQRRAARRFIDAGADMVIGGHPHWVQGWEQINGGLVVHSLGNFIFDMDFMRETQEGILLELVLWDGELKAAEPTPYVIGDDFAPRPAGGKRAHDIMAMIRETSRGPYN